MDAGSKPSRKGTEQLVGEVNEQLKLMQATELAAEGQFEQALTVLNTLPKSVQTNGSVADLRARIAAQQGDIKSAESYWSRAVEADPENPTYKASLERVRADLNRPSLLRWNYRALGIVFVSIIAVVLLYLSFTALWQIQATQAALVERIDSIEKKVVENWVVGDDSAYPGMSELAQKVLSLEETLSDEMDVINQELSTQGDHLAGMSATQLEILSQLSRDTLEPIDISLAGIQTQVDGGLIRIRFEEGLFLYGSTLREGGREMILDLGQALNPYLSNYHISVIGFTDDNERESGLGSLLNLLRAERVVELLAQATNLAVEDLAIELPGDRPAPYSNTSLQNRLRNRTVLILLTPLAQ